MVLGVKALGTQKRERNGSKEVEENIEKEISVVNNKLHNFPIFMAIFKPTPLPSKLSHLNLLIGFYFDHIPSPNHCLQII